eukprot:6906137-Prymnesium_polylepis.1
MHRPCLDRPCHDRPCHDHSHADVLCSRSVRGESARLHKGGGRLAAPPPRERGQATHASHKSQRGQAPPEARTTSRPKRRARSCFDLVGARVISPTSMRCARIVADASRSPAFRACRCGRGEAPISRGAANLQVLFAWRVVARHEARSWG